jgi:hypothetical protein
MSEPPPPPKDDQAHIAVEKFIFEQIDTVPHLEALLLIWNRRPKVWTAAEMASALYVSPEESGKFCAILYEAV